MTNLCVQIEYGPKLLKLLLPNRPLDITDVDHQEIFEVIFCFVCLGLFAIAKSCRASCSAFCRQEAFRPQFFSGLVVFADHLRSGFGLVRLPQEVFTVNAGGLSASGCFVEAVIAGNNQNLSRAAVSLRDQFNLSIGVSTFA